MSNEALPNVANAYTVVGGKTLAIQTPQKSALTNVVAMTASNAPVFPEATSHEDPAALAEAVTIAPANLGPVAPIPNNEPVIADVPVVPAVEAVSNDLPVIDDAFFADMNVRCENALATLNSLVAQMTELDISIRNAQKDVGDIKAVIDSKVKKETPAPVASQSFEIPGSPTANAQMPEVPTMGSM